MVFSYKAKTARGKTVRGEIQVPIEGKAAEILRKRNLVIIWIRPSRRSIARAIAVMFRRVRMNDVVTFTRQFATMVASGLPLTDALKILRSQTSPAMAPVLASVSEDVEGGMSLADALSKNRRVFSPVYIALVRAGEAAGVLDSILGRLADSLEKQKEFTAKVKHAMIYPAIVIIGMIVVSFIMMVFVVPKLTEIYKGFGTELPAATKALLLISSAVASYWIHLAFLTVATAAILAYWLRTATGQEVFYSYLLRIPVIGRLMLNVILTEFTRTLSVLIGAGVSIIDGLTIAADVVGNALIKSEILDAAQQVEKGLPLAVPFAQSEYFPPILSQMVSVGEETGKLDEVLMKISAYFEAESNQSVSALTAAVEPIIMIVLGLGVGFLVIAIIMPIYSLNAAF